MESAHLTRCRVVDHCHTAAALCRQPWPATPRLLLPALCEPRSVRVQARPPL